MIIIWSGVEGTIPAGWQKADGTNGTHDLQSGFVRGASNDGQIGLPGGVNSHVHPFTGDGHNHNHIDGPPFIDGTGGPAFQLGVSTENAIGTTDSASNIPGHIKLYYIQKVA